MKVSLELLREISFFDHFEDDLLKQTLEFFKFEHFIQEQCVLDQNQINTQLFFLIKGTIDIFVDEEYVVSISKPGEVFGEVSMAAQTTCSAKIIAATKSDFLVWDARSLEAKDPNTRLRFEKALYRSCAEVLAKKLTDTNELAKTYRQLALED